jgi:hypothetical protein
MRPDTAHLLETRVRDPRTASRVLSVVYATDKNGENPKLQAIRPRASFTSWVLFPFCSGLSYGQRCGIVQRSVHRPAIGSSLPEEPPTWSSENFISYLLTRNVGAEAGHIRPPFQFQREMPSPHGEFPEGEIV